MARTAYSLCGGWCCWNGGDEAFLDDRTLARLRLTNPKITEQAIELIYLARVPEAVYQDSCIFHGKRGCTLDRSMRADICNTYFCGGLRAYMKSRTDPEPTVCWPERGTRCALRPSLCQIRKHSKILRQSARVIRPRTAGRRRGPIRGVAS